MRALRRPSPTPPTLNDPELALLARGLARRDKAASADFPDKWWRGADVLGALYAMHGIACAYCGVGLTRSDSGDVEHFRPKTIYPYLAYRWENYLLSCLYCNRRRKIDRFPLAGTAAPWPLAKLRQLAKEPRLLLDPSADPVEQYVTFDWRSQDIPMIVATAPPADASSPSVLERVGGTVEFFWLNRSAELLRERLELLGVLLEDIDANLRERVSRRASRFVQHGALARAIVSAARPTWLPSPRDEVLWLIDSLVNDLTLATRAGDLAASVEAPRESTKWALAFLWHDPPPPLTAADVERRLKRHGVVEKIRPSLEKLSV